MHSTPTATQISIIAIQATQAIMMGVLIGESSILVHRRVAM